MFRFGLAPLLRFRKRQEEEKLRELALINQEMLLATNRINDLKKRRSENARKLTEISAGIKEVNTIRLYEDYLAGCESDLLQGLVEQGEIGGRQTKKREELIEYVRRRRAMELYRDRLKERYDTKEKRRERVESDDIADKLFFREAP